MFQIFVIKTSNLRYQQVFIGNYVVLTIILNDFQCRFYESFISNWFFSVNPIHTDNDFFLTSFQIFFLYIFIIHVLICMYKGKNKAFAF